MTPVARDAPGCVGSRRSEALPRHPGRDVEPHCADARAGVVGNFVFASHRTRSPNKALEGSTGMDKSDLAILLMRRWIKAFEGV